MKMDKCLDWISNSLQQELNDFFILYLGLTGPVKNSFTALGSLIRV